MERKQVKTYRVVDLTSGRVFDFERAEAVAQHVATIEPSYRIFKAGRLWHGAVDGDLARALHRWVPG